MARKAGARERTKTSKCVLVHILSQTFGQGIGVLDEHPTEFPLLSTEFLLLCMLGKPCIAALHYHRLQIAHHSTPPAELACARRGVYWKCNMYVDIVTPVPAVVNNVCRGEGGGSGGAG